MKLKLIYIMNMVQYQNIILAFSTEKETNKILPNNELVFDSISFQNSYIKFNKTIEALFEK